MAESSANPFDAISAELAAEAERLGQRITEEKRADLAVQVVYTDHGTIRSKPGEPPRRETGNLQGSIQARVRREDGGRITAIEFDTPVGYAERLQLEMNRPILSDVADRFGDEWVDLCAAVISGGSGGGE